MLSCVNISIIIRKLVCVIYPAYIYESYAVNALDQKLWFPKVRMFKFSLASVDFLFLCCVTYTLMYVLALKYRTKYQFDTVQKAWMFSQVHLLALKRIYELPAYIFMFYLAVSFLL